MDFKYTLFETLKQLLSEFFFRFKSILHSQAKPKRNIKYRLMILLKPPPLQNSKNCKLLNNSKNSNI